MHVSIIDLSDNIPNALITINKGIGFLTLGITTTICLLVKEGVAPTNLTAVVLTGLEASSERHLTSAEHT